MTVEPSSSSQAPEPDVVGLLLTRVGTGDRDAFADLYDQVSGRVFGLVLRVLVDRAQSEEVLQEVFLEIWQSASSFAPNKGRGRSWIMTLAHRRAVDRVRSAQAATERDVKAGYRELADSPPSVADEVELRLEGEQVNEALQTLPDPQRQALTLAYFGGYSQTEIAEMVGAPLGTVKTRIRDGLQRIRQRMGVTS